eukprot:15473617-Alexandrium_andersonii.AAC.1
MSFCLTNLTVLQRRRGARAGRPLGGASTVGRAVRAGDGRGANPAAGALGATSARAKTPPSSEQSAGGSSPRSSCSGVLPRMRSIGRPPPPLMWRTLTREIPATEPPLEAWPPTPRKLLGMVADAAAPLPPWPCPAAAMHFATAMPSTAPPRLLLRACRSFFRSIGVSLAPQPEELGWGVNLRAGRVPLDWARAATEELLPAAVLSPDLGRWASTGAVDDHHCQCLLADAVGREAALLQQQERAREETAPEGGELPLVAIDVKGSFLQGLCAAVSVLGVPCAAVAMSMAFLRRGESPGPSWAMAAAQRIWQMRSAAGGGTLCGRLPGHAGRGAAPLPPRALLRHPAEEPASAQVVAQASAAVEMEAAVEWMALQLRREGWAPAKSTGSLRPGRHLSMGGPFV